jgi:hypothetical protein
MKMHFRLFLIAGASFLVSAITYLFADNYSTWKDIKDILIPVASVFLAIGFAEYASFKSKNAKFNYGFNLLGSGIKNTLQLYNGMIEDVKKCQTEHVLRATAAIPLLPSLSSDIWFEDKGINKWCLEAVTLVDTINYNIQASNYAITELLSEINTIKNKDSFEQNTSQSLIIQNRILRSIGSILSNENLFRKVLGELETKIETCPAFQSKN